LCFYSIGGKLFDQPIYKSATDIPDTIEGAVISISAKFTVDALKQCLEKGAKWVTIVPGGFRETGTKEGIAAEVIALLLSLSIGRNPAFG
jgi:acyl-CoA synthetase (NDP forming)